MERRSLDIEVRANEENLISGTAARYYDGSDGTQYRLWGNVYERIAKGAFDEALADDVVALFNHDANQVLGRTPNTLRLYTDDSGLRYDIVPDETTIAQDVLKMIRRGDVRGSSFAFKVLDEDWTEEKGKEVRTIKKVKLYDVSPVTYPAYQGTSANVRKNEEAKDRYDSWQTQKRLLRLSAL